jgi:hypothetical protein
MRFSLFVTADHLHGGVHSRHYETLEQQVIAAELHGFAAVWLSEGWSDVPPDLFSTVRLLHRLSAVTDRIDLGALVRLPHPTSRSRLLEALVRLDTLSGGRMRLAVDPGACAPEAALDVALSVAEELREQGKPWLARRVLLVAHESSAAQMPVRLGVINRCSSRATRYRFGLPFTDSAGLAELHSLRRYVSS